ncbi:MAG TPA: hypothetical protein VNN99_19695 [Vicinamibacterales bacterium]|nr:hypothetical protein [Vicinamibacterales bacterium]HXR43464.1 hypothetical protein [Pseudolysinimonas sp.]
MAISLDRVATISREVATALDDRLSVAGVSATEGGGGRVEVLVTVEGCHAEPCRHLLNVTRTEAGVLEDELRSKLLAALTAHHPE